MERSNLSKTERKVTEFFEKNQKKVIDVTVVADIVYSEKSRPYYWRQATCGLMRSVIRKLNEEKHPLKIIRASKLGNARYAEYYAHAGKIGDRTRKESHDG